MLPPKSRWTGYLRRWAGMLGKYGLTSISATGVDFLAFHLALTWTHLTAVQATVVGRSVGALVAFLLQRKWVFRKSTAARWWFVAVKYSAGVLLGMGFNVFGVWALHDLAEWEPWPARIVAAMLGWALIFVFNHTLVFRPARVLPSS